MPYAVSTYSAGRTGSAPVAPLRASPPDRKPANALSREDEIQADPPESRKNERGRENRPSDASTARAAAQQAAVQQQAERRVEAERTTEQDQNKEAGEASERKHDATREATAESAGERRIAAEQSQGGKVEGRREAEQAAEAERRRAEAADLTKPEPKTTGPASQEDIKKLEQIRARALYPTPPSAESRELAQRAHVELIRAEAELKAYELEQSRQKYRDAEAARFRRDQAAVAYRQLEEFDARERGRLH